MGLRCNVWNVLKMWVKFGDSGEISRNQKWQQLSSKEELTNFLNRYNVEGYEFNPAPEVDMEILQIVKPETKEIVTILIKKGNDLSLSTIERNITIIPTPDKDFIDELVKELKK